MSHELQEVIYKMCGKKTMYDSLFEAELSASVRDDVSKGIHAYKCKFCAGWHIGHTKKLMPGYTAPTASKKCWYCGKTIKGQAATKRHFKQHTAKETSSNNNVPGNTKDPMSRD